MTTSPAPREDSDEIVRRWIRGAWLVAGVLALVAGFYLALLQSLIAEAETGVYRDHWRASYYIARLEGYGWFLPLLSAGVAIWALALTARHRLASMFVPGSRSRLPLNRIAGSLVVASLLVAATHYSHGEWLYYEKQCWDGYCDHAAMFASWFGGEESAGTRLLDYARSDYHANSWLVPLLSGLTSWLTGGSVEATYRVLVAMASLLTVGVFARWLLPGLGVGRAARFPAVVLLASHLFFVRSFFYPQTDPFVMLWMTVLVTLALEQDGRRGAGRAIAMIAVLVLGLFTKLSFLPALAIVPGWRVLSEALSEGAFDSRRLVALAGKLLADGALYVVLPLGVFLGYQGWVGSLDLYAHEFDRMATLDTSTVYHLLCLLQLTAVPAALCWLRERSWSRIEWLLAAWAGLYIASLWYAQTSGWGRFYLPVLPVVVAIAAPGLTRITEVAGAPVMWSLVVIAAVLNYAAMSLHVYY